MKKIILNKKQLNVIKEYWDKFKTAESHYYGSLKKLEMEMSKKTGIKDLEYFFCDDGCAGIGCAGIGNVDRTLKLITREKLEKEK